MNYLNGENLGKAASSSTFVLQVRTGHPFFHEYGLEKLFYDYGELLAL